MGGNTGAFIFQGFYASLSRETCLLLRCGVPVSALLFF
jgi:hypothetical protein